MHDSLEVVARLADCLPEIDVGCRRNTKCVVQLVSRLLICSCRFILYELAGGLAFDAEETVKETKTANHKSDYAEGDGEDQDHRLGYLLLVFAVTLLRSLRLGQLVHDQVKNLDHESN